MTGDFPTNLSIDLDDGSQPFGIASGLVDGDANLDILVSLGFPDDFMIFYGDGTGNFNTSITIDAPPFVSDYPLLEDFNGDGFADIVTNVNDGGIWLATYINDGTGSFGDYTRSENQMILNQLTTADVNQDGNKDITYSYFNQLGVVLGNGDGTFGDAIITDFGNDQATNVTPIGINGSGGFELMVSLSNPEAIALMELNESFEYETQRTIFTGSRPGEGNLAIEDFDQNGFDDIAIPLNTNSVKVILKEQDAFLQDETFQVLDFDGIDDHVEIADLRPYNADFTWEGWVLPQDNGPLFSFTPTGTSSEWESSGTGGFSLAIKDGFLSLMMEGNTELITGTQVLIDGNWHHIALTVDIDALATDEISIYIDGQRYINSGRDFDGSINVADLNYVSKLGYATGDFAQFAGSFGQATGSNWTDGVTFPPPTTGRAYAAEWMNGDNIYIFGGEGNEGIYNSIRQFNTTTNSWTTIKGSDTPGDPGDYGTLNIPSTTNVPPARWIVDGTLDPNGDFWVFGGAATQDTVTWLNDLWAYDTTALEWTWKGGSNGINELPIYGTQGIPNAANLPGPRENNQIWSDASGNIWVFGGYGIDKNGNEGFLNDLWRWNPTSMEWTWMAGSDTVNQGGVYGELGQYSADNYPGARAASIQWQDTNGIIWIFGGQGYDKFGVSQEHLNDLWSYNPSTGQWAWHAGSDFANSTGSYNETGLSSVDYVPGARWHASEWIDENENLWLFGGFLPNQVTTGRLNDFWKYEPTSREWTWLSGENSTTGIEDIGTYGDLNLGGKPFPGARHGALSWTDPAGDFWMLGGRIFGTGYFTDLWKYEPAKEEWTFVRGSIDPILNEGVYGAQGIGSPTNEPKSRWHGASWLGDDGRLWFFGGLNQNTNTNTVAWLNDLWVYDPASDIYTWMGGSSEIDGDAVYGIQGEASAAHIPGAKSSAAYWTDSNGIFWLFGGYESFEYNNDLWKFNPNTLEWTWVNGNNFQNTPGTHGELGVAAESNEIGSRRYMDAWQDNEGFIWIFGGQGIDGEGQLGYLNDLWKYDPSTNLWTWMGGNTLNDQIGNYGTQGVASPDNIPSARYAHTTWTDDSGNLWLFGGVGILGEDQETSTATWLNDLWKYDIRTNMWTWVAGNGPDAVSDGVFGVHGVFDENNIPFARERTQKFETIDKSLFFFGGRQGSTNTRNDFWEIKFTPGETFIESPSELLQTEFTFSYDEPWAETYQIQVALSDDFSDVFYDQVTTEAIGTIPSLEAGTNYYYHINAINEIGSSGFGTTQSTLTLPATPEFESLALAVTDIASTTVNINWLTTSGILDGYEMDISTSQSFDDDTQFLDGYQGRVLSAGILENVTGLNPGTIYYVRLRSFNSSGFSPYSETVEFLTTPETPTYDATEVINEIGQNAASIVWNAVPEILTGYRLTVSTDETLANPDSTLAEYDARGILKDRNSIPIVGLEPGTQYYAFLTAFNSSGESIPSNTISILTLPESPVFADASIQAVTQNSVQITWVAPAEVFDGYELEVSTDFSFNNTSLMLAGYGRGGIPNTIDKTENTDDIQNLNPGETYYARIRSYNSSGDSPNSNIIELLTVPSAPEFNPVGNVKQESASLSWSVTDGTETYLLDLNTSENFEASTTVLSDFPLAVTFRALTDLTPGTRYYARVQSSNVSGSSGNMAPADYDSTTFITIPANPVLNEPDQIGQNSIRVSWPAVEGAASYEVDVSDNFFQTFLVDYNERLILDSEIIIQDLDPGSEYQIRVRSKNVSGESDEAINLDLLTVPETPIARDATNSSANVFTANWDPVSGADYYVLEVSTDDFQTFHYNEQLGSSNPVQISNLTAGETYKYRVRSGNASGESPNSNEISIVAQNTAQSLSLSSVAFDDEFGEATTSVLVTATVSGGLANPEVTIRHRRILSSDWSDLIQMTSISETQFEFEITSVMLDDIGVEFEIYANDQVTFVESLGNLIKRTFTETNSEALPALNLGEWQMISIPYVLEDDLVTSIFNELGNLEYLKKWRLMSYINEEYQDQGVGFTRIELGRGYWFNSLTDVTINVGAGQTNGAIPFELALEAGWNQIGNPYNVTINWNTIVNSNGLSGIVDGLIVFNTTLRDFQGSNTLDAFEGAFVWSDQAVVVPIDPMTGAGGRTVDSDVEEFSGNDWKKELHLNWNGQSRSLAAIGMHGSATELKDRYDQLTIPRFENYLEMYTTKEEYFYPYFSEDIQSHSETTVWNFSLESNYVSGLVELSWDTKEVGGNLWLLDEQTGVVTNMSSTNSYPLSLSGASQLSIHYSTDPNYEPVPQNFILGDVYPNPVSGEANIPLMLPEDTQLELNLYNLQGRIVKQLAKGSYPAGVHFFKLDIDTEEIQDGIYFVRLSSDKLKSSHKKILIRH
ncbi:MAG: fibronectin type III domain-containing protein [Bacteroidota bacterium]